MTTDEARSKLHARQEAETVAMEQRNALELLELTDRHRNEYIVLGRRQIAERDLLTTATPDGR